MNSNDENWLDYSKETFPLQVFRNITKFDLLSSTVSIPQNSKTYIDYETLIWLKKAERTNKIPQNYLSKIDLLCSKIYPKHHSYRKFSDKKILFKTFSDILYKAYGYDEKNNTRGYGSGGALYPVNTIIFILNDRAVEKLKKGTYYFYPAGNCLYQLNTFTEETSQKLQLALYPSKKVADSNIAIGYAVDMRKVVRKYKYLGYKMH